MEIKTGYLYHIKDEFFDKINENKIMINHENGHSRPSYLAIKDKDILWFIPLSSKIDKYQKIVDKKIKKYGKCSGIVICEIASKKEVVLIQNAFPTLEKYVKSRHMINGRYVKITESTKNNIFNNFKYMLSMKEKGNNLFFTDIDKIKELMLDELSIKV